MQIYKKYYTFVTLLWHFYDIFDTFGTLFKTSVLVLVDKFLLISETGGLKQFSELVNSKPPVLYIITNIQTKNTQCLRLLGQSQCCNSEEKNHCQHLSLDNQMISSLKCSPPLL